MVTITLDYIGSNDIPTSVALTQIIRTDTGGPVSLPSPPTFVPSGNTFTISFTEPAPGLTYAYAFTRTFSDGSTSTGTGTIVGLNSSATSRYTNVNSFQRRWGIKNVATQSNKDVTSNSTNRIPDWNSVQDAFNWAADEVESSLRGGILAVPLSFSGGIPPVVTEWNNVLAYWYLYSSRGLEESDKVGNRLKKMVNEVYLDIRFYRNGMKMFQSPTYQVATSGAGAQDATATPVYPWDIWMDELQNGWLFGFWDFAPVFPGGTI